MGHKWKATSSQAKRFPTTQNVNLIQSIDDENGRKLKSAVVFVDLTTV